MPASESRHQDHHAGESRGSGGGCRWMESRMASVVSKAVASFGGL